MQWSMANTTGSDRPFLSVVIPVGRVDASLVWCLRALASQTLAREYFEVIVVLDGVSLPAGMPTAGLRVCAVEARAGRSAARNRGIAEARGNVVVSLDCDMVASPDLLACYYEAHQRERLACVGVRRFAHPSGGLMASNFDFAGLLSACDPRPDYRERFYRATDYMRNAAEPFWAFWTCNCSYPLDIARQSGLFDDQMTGWGLEDVEFAYRLWRSGAVDFQYLPGAVAIHMEHERDKPAEWQEWSSNRAYCVRKHGALFADHPHRRDFPVLKGESARNPDRSSAPPFPPPQ